MEELGRRVDRWVEAGVIGREQGDAILVLEGTYREPAGGRRAVAVEVLGYLGGGLALVAGFVLGAESWTQLGHWGRVAVLAVVTGVLLAAGWRLRGDRGRGDALTPRGVLGSLDDAPAGTRPLVERRIDIVDVDPQRDAVAGSGIRCLRITADAEGCLAQRQRDVVVLVPAREAIGDLAAERLLVEADEPREVTCREDREQLPHRHADTLPPASARSVEEDVGEQLVVRRAGHGRVAREVGDAGIPQHVLDDQRLPRVFARGLGDHLVGGVGIHLGRAADLHHRVAAEGELHGRGRDRRRRPQRVRRNPRLGELGRQSERRHRHAVLRERVAGVGAEPLRRKVERRREREDVRVLGILQDRDGRAAEHERAADVDVLHEVVLLRLQVERAREVDDARVVDDDVDAAELALGLEDGLGDVVVVAHVAHDRQCPAARGADQLGRGMHRALELGVRGVGLREQGDVRAVPRRAQGDREADTAAPARHQDGLAGELLVGHGVSSESAGGFGGCCGEGRDTRFRIVRVEAGADRGCLVIEVLDERPLGADAYQALGLAVGRRRVLEPERRHGRGTRGDLVARHHLRDETPVERLGRREAAVLQQELQRAALADRASRRRDGRGRA